MATKIVTWVDGERVGEGYFTDGKFGGGWSKSDKFEMHLTAKYFNKHADTSDDSSDTFDVVNIIFNRKTENSEVVIDELDSDDSQFGWRLRDDAPPRLPSRS